MIVFFYIVVGLFCLTAYMICISIVLEQIEKMQLVAAGREMELRTLPFLEGRFALWASTKKSLVVIATVLSPLIVIPTMLVVVVVFVAVATWVLITDVFESARRQRNNPPWSE